MKKDWTTFDRSVSLCNIDGNKRKQKYTHIHVRSNRESFLLSKLRRLRLEDTCGLANI